AAALADAARESAGLDPEALKAALDEPGFTFDARIGAEIAAIASGGPQAAVTAAERDLARDAAGLARAESIDLRGLSRNDVHVVADLAAAWRNDPARVVASRLAEIRSGQSRMLLGRALGVVDLLVDAIGRAHPSLTLHPAGSLRRFEPTVGDLLVLAAGD